MHDFSNLLAFSDTRYVGRILARSGPGSVLRGTNETVHLCTSIKYFFFKKKGKYAIRGEK